MTTRKPAHVSLRGIGKSFHGVQALRDVSLTIERGTVHALVGENGAGKSTLGRIIAGVLRGDNGEMLVDGRPLRLGSPRAALRHGIAIVQQEVALVPQQTVLQNVSLGVPSGALGVIDRRARRRRFEELCERVGIDLDPDVAVGALRIPEQQQVELVRALNHDARLIILDEPTASLTDSEARRLLALVSHLRQSGITVVYVSHDLDHVLGLSDTITVLRNGRTVRTAPAAQEDRSTLIAAMLGRPADLVFPPKRPPAPVRTALAVRDLSRPPAVHGVSFELHAGEILGLAGIVGSGRSELARLIAGADRAASGQMLLEGRPARIACPRDAIQAGIALIPESRKDDGLLLGRSIAENISLPNLRRFTRGGVLSLRQERSSVLEVMEQLDVRPRRPRARAEHLSGGNQQKVLFGKWLARRPSILLADEPTRGVDVGAKAAIYDLIASLAEQGLGILLISSEIEEVIGLAHRVLVMRRGRMVAEFAADDIRQEPILRAALTGEVSARQAPTGLEA